MHCSVLCCFVLFVLFCLFVWLGFFGCLLHVVVGLVRTTCQNCSTTFAGTYVVRCMMPLAAFGNAADAGVVVNGVQRNVASA